MESVREANNGVILEIKVKTNSLETKVYRKDDSIILEVQNPPEDNQANIELIKYLKKFFGKEVRILRGLKSKNKTILIENLSKKDFESAFS